MDNVEKLLRAFIEASCYEIEECVDMQHHIYDYKVTKKESPLDKMFQCGQHKVSLSQLVNNIVEISTYEEEFRFINYSKEIIDAIISSKLFEDIETINEGSYSIYGVKVSCDERT